LTYRWLRVIILEDKMAKSSFAASVRNNSTKALKQVSKQAAEVTKFLFNRVVEYTPSPNNPGPYADGYLVNQWFPEYGGYFSEDRDTRTSPFGANSLSRIAALSNGMFYGRDNSITLTNNVDYAYRAEALGWPGPEWSGSIGPYRMVARAIQTTKAKYL
jgi:hypothetical protein